MDDLQDDLGSFSARTIWRENHGNLLLVVFAATCLVGAGFLAYRQWRIASLKAASNRAVRTVVSGAAKQPDRPDRAVTIRVEGAESDKGKMMIALYDSAGSFNNPEYAVIRGAEPINDGSVVLEIPAERLPDPLAVAAFHDANDNRKLDRNAFGIPTERYGFSNDARGLTGPPSFAAATVEPPFEGRVIDVTVR